MTTAAARIEVTEAQRYRRELGAAKAAASKLIAHTYSCMATAAAAWGNDSPVAARAAHLNAIASGLNGLLTVEQRASSLTVSVVSYVSPSDDQRSARADTEGMAKGERPMTTAGIRVVLPPEAGNLTKWWLSDEGSVFMLVCSYCQPENPALEGVASWSAVRLSADEPGRNDSWRGWRDEPREAVRGLYPCPPGTDIGIIVK